MFLAIFYHNIKDTWKWHVYWDQFYTWEVDTNFTPEKLKTPLAKQTIFVKHSHMFQKMKCFLVRTFDEHVYTLLDTYELDFVITITKSYVNMHLQSTLKANHIQIKYVVTLCLAHYLTICSMCNLFVRTPKLFDSLIFKYTTKDVIRQRFVIEKYYQDD